MIRKILFYLMVSTTLCYSQQPSQTGNIKGVVTYNSEYGDRADIGAKIFLTDSSSLSPSINLSSLDTLIACSFYIEHYKHGKANEEEMKRLMKRRYKPSDYFESTKKKLAEFNLEDDGEKFKALDNRAIRQSMNLYEDNKLKAVADGNGNYSIKVKPGTYYVFIRSNNRKSISITEVSGKVYYKKIKVKIDDEINVSKNFY